MIHFFIDKYSFKIFFLVILHEVKGRTNYILKLIISNCSFYLQIILYRKLICDRKKLIIIFS